jgi:hypothetical protein
MPHDAHSSIDSLLLSLRSMFDPQAARGLRVTITLRVEEHPFHVEIIDGELNLAGGEATVTGTTAVLARFLQLFPLPEPAAAR